MTINSNSGLLAEITSNQTYLDAATLAASFIYSHLYNTTTNIALDTISGRANDSCSVADFALPYDSGVFIEGLAMIANTTGDLKWQSLYVSQACRMTKTD